MIREIFSFLNVIAAALVAGTLVFVFVGFRPFGLPSESFTIQQQILIGALGRLMTSLGPTLLILTIISAYLQRKDRISFLLLFTAVAFVIVNTLLSAFGNVPINEIVMGWKSSDAPSNWTEYRDKWWWLNNFRVIGALVIFLLVAWSHSRVRLLHQLSEDV